jgi:hypothetical protein
VQHERGARSCDEANNKSAQRGSAATEGVTADDADGAEMMNRSKLRKRRL